MFSEPLIMSIDALKNDFDRHRNLVKLKNDLIGCQERKEMYFDQGLLETLFPMITNESLGND